jgi:hypothetical protein
MGWRRLLVAVRFWDGDWVVAAMEGRLGGDEVYIWPSGWCCCREGSE